MTYYEDGSVKSISTLVNGKLYGESRDFYPNGQLKEVMTFKNNVVIDTSISFHENGILKSKVPFVEGITYGQTLYYYDNGQLKQMGYYVNDKAHGRFYHFHKNGNIEAVQQVENDSITVFTTFDEEGAIIGASYNTYSEASDTVNLNEEVKIKLGFTGQIFDSLNVIIGNISQDGSSLADTIKVLGSNSHYQITYRFTPKEPGKQTFGSLVQNIAKMDSLGEEHYIVIPFFFKIDYYVKSETSNLVGLVKRPNYPIIGRVREKSWPFLRINLFSFLIPDSEVEEIKDHFFGIAASTTIPQ